MPSVKSRIKQFEALSGENGNEQSPAGQQAASKPAKKFLYPGHAQEQSHSPIDHLLTSSQQPVRTSNAAGDMLEEVWSVKRNIGVGRVVPPSNTKRGAATGSNLYSRHGALPAQLGTSAVNRRETKDFFPSPLQDLNQDGVRRNVKAGGYSYLEGAAKRPHDLPTNVDTLPPANKRKQVVGIASIISRPVPSTGDNDNIGLPPIHQKLNDKKRKYAEKMSNAYLRSAGLGEFAPKPTNSIDKRYYDDRLSSPGSRRTRHDDSSDDFDF